MISIISSCQKEENSVTNTDSFDPIKQEPKAKYNVLDYTVGNYKNYLIQTNEVLGFHSSQRSLGPSSTFSNFTTLNFRSLNLVKINGKKIKKGETKNSIENFDSDQIFGKTLRFEVLGDKKSKEDTLYIPKKLNISKPELQDKRMDAILAYANDFSLEWNADPKNTEGLMIAVFYNGENAVSKNSENVLVRNIDHIEKDNGKYVLNEAMFDEIPNLAFVDIVLLRGNVQIENIDDTSYKIFAESHQRIHLLLIKDKNSIQTIND